MSNNKSFALSQVLTVDQYEVLQSAVETAKSNPTVVRLANILRSAPLDSDEFKFALCSAGEYGPSPEVCAIWMLVGRVTRSSDINIVEEIMEDTYHERMTRIHASKMTGAIVTYYNTPPK
jgi:hypothetical protein